MIFTMVFPPYFQKIEANYPKNLGFFPMNVQKTKTPSHTQLGVKQGIENENSQPLF
ncbi:hypothetical protein Mh1961_05330 [Mannheimia haemolytica]